MNDPALRMEQLKGIRDLLSEHTPEGMTPMAKVREGEYGLLVVRVVIGTDWQGNSYRTFLMNEAGEVVHEQ